MVSVTAGADPDELDRLAVRFNEVADQITAVQKSLNPRINSSPWHGRSADRFRQRWSGEHRRAIAEAVAFLNSGAGDLQRNAREQRDVSRDGGAGQDLVAKFLTPDESGSADGDPGGALVDFLEGMGLSAEQIEEITGALGDKLGQLGLLADILENDALAGFIKGVGEVLDVVGVVIDFVKDVAENAGTLPLDELLIHAVVETTVRFAVNEGAGAAVQVITPVLLSVVPVAGTAAGVVIGKVAGFIVEEAVDAVVGEAVDSLDQKYNIYDGPADAAVDGYKYLKQNDFNAVDIALDKAKEVGSMVAEGAENLYGDVESGFKNLIGLGG